MKSTSDTHPTPELFAAEKTLSPRAAWKKQHALKTWTTLDGWAASTVEHTAHGKTEDEAMANWASKARLPDWDGKTINTDPQS